MVYHKLFHRWLCDCQQIETFIFRIHNYLSSNPPLTTQLFIWPINILYQLYVWQHYNCSQYRKEWIPVQKTAVTCILAIIIYISFYTCPFLMVIAMMNDVCGVKKWPIWWTLMTLSLSLTWTQFLAQLHITRISWHIALNFFLWITFSCYTKAVTVQVTILLYVQTWESIRFYCENWSIFQFGDMYWLTIVTFSNTAITFVM
jgi:hypothetical protein